MTQPSFEAALLRACSSQGLNKLERFNFAKQDEPHIHEHYFVPVHSQTLAVSTHVDIDPFGRLRQSIGVRHRTSATSKKQYQDCQDGNGNEGEESVHSHSLFDTLSEDVAGFEVNLLAA